jgi:hypothetical protein
MAKMPDGSNLFTYMQNDGGTRSLVWISPSGAPKAQWFFSNFNNFTSPSFWYYDGVSIDYVGNGRFVLVWTENADGVADGANEIYWCVGQLSVSSTAHPTQPAGTDTFSGPAIVLSEAGSAETSLTDTTGFTLESGEHLTDGDDNEVGGSVWWKFTPLYDGVYQISCFPTEWLTGYEDAGAPLNVYTGSSVDSLTVIGSDYGNSGSNWKGSLTLTLIAGETYHIRVSTWLMDIADPTSQLPINAAVKITWADEGLYPGYTWPY